MSFVFSARNQPALPIQFALAGTADAGFEGAGDDLLERRVGHQGVRQIAGLRGVGAAEFDGRWRAVRFAVAEVGAREVDRSIDHSEPRD